MIPTLTRGDLKPDVVITISDSRADADFSDLTTANVRVIGEINGVEVFNSLATVVTPAEDGKSAEVRRAWSAGDTDVVGRMWVRVVVTWPGGPPQTFPKGTPPYLDIRRAAGDA
jgi:hypothetical protein